MNYTIYKKNFVFKIYKFSLLYRLFEKGNQNKKNEKRK